MRHSKNRQKPKNLKFEKEPVEIEVAPFGLFAFHKGKLVNKEIWNEKEQAEKYLNKEEEIKKFKSKIAIKAKYEIRGIFGAEAEHLAKEQGIRFDFQRFMVELTKLKIKTGFSKDKLVIQASNMLEESNKIINMFYERLSEWYGFYWPEQIPKMKSVEEFSRIVGKKRTEQSMGFDLEEEDLETIRTASDELKSLISFRENLSKYIEKLMEEIAPNTSKIAGPVLGAKFISIAGGLKKLAEMPSSTVQVLGAERALFRHLRKGTKPPKHGIILSHALMPKVKPSNRGKLARLLSSKISIAAKVDYYSQGKDIRWKELLKNLEEKMEKLR